MDVRRGGYFAIVTTRNLQRSEWQRYFDDLSRHLPATEVELRVEGLDVGDQLTFGANTSLLGIGYDPNDDALEVATEGAAHRVQHPKGVVIEESAEGLNAVEVIDPEGRQHIIILRRPLQLAGN